MTAAGSRAAAHRRGITLIELLVALALAGMILAISFPSFTAGLEGLRLAASGRRVGGFVNAARARAERDQEPVEIRVDPRSGRLSALSARGDWQRDLPLEDGVRIAAVLPPASADARPDEPRRFVLLPGVPGPRMEMRLTSQTGRAITVAIDPISGVPEVVGEAR
jgi:prepilin-type N-terminal cleavage/methylation domain-containing protein